MNSQQCLAEVSELAFSSLVCRRRAPRTYFCAVSKYLWDEGKSQGNKLNEVISTGRGGKKVVSKCFCLKGTTDFPSPHISFVWMLYCCRQLEKKKALQNDFITALSFWISDWKLGYVTGFRANSIPPPVSEAPAPLERAPAVESRPCSAPRLIPPARVRGLTTHTAPESSPDTLAGVPTGFFSIPQVPAPGRPWLRRPRTTRSHQAQQLALLPVCQQKAKSGEERSAGLKQQWIKREGR